MTPPAIQANQPVRPALGQAIPLSATAPSRPLSPARRSRPKRSNFGQPADQHACQPKKYCISASMPQPTRRRPNGQGPDPLPDPIGFPYIVLSAPGLDQTKEIGKRHEIYRQPHVHLGSRSPPCRTISWTGRKSVAGFSGHAAVYCGDVCTPT